MGETMAKIMVLGAYGLIGSAIVRRLVRAGHQVVGVGRSRQAADAFTPQIQWIIADLTRLSVDEWRAHLAGIDGLVNAAGALQDGPRDDVMAIHVTMMERILAASSDLSLRIIQVSAAGVCEAASTAFFRTKACADALIIKKARDWVILKPVLVLSPEAYGGTALLRAGAALPGVALYLFDRASIQTVHVEDVAGAVLSCVEGQIASGTIADLCEDETHSFGDLVGQIRRWQGFPAPHFSLSLPSGGLRLLGWVADGLGLLGWRTPMRTTALSALADGITGSSAAWRAAGGAPCRSLSETLEDLAPTRQERLYARAYLFTPLAIGVLSLFWIVSGLIALLDPSRAHEVLASSPLPLWAMHGLVEGGGLIDVALGLGLIWRRTTRLAALGVIVVSAGYLLGSVMILPQLWLDPLGPMVKVLPGVVLALWVWLGVER